MPVERRVKLMTKWNLPKPAHIQECIEQWRHLDLRSATDAEIEASFVELRDRIGRVAVQNHVSSYSNLWRVRRDGVRFEGPTDFWWPPAAVAGQGRCNRPGEPALYCARSAVTAVDEMDVQVGEQIVLINYESRNMRLGRVVGHFDPNPANGDRILDGDDLCSYRILREFLYSEFTKPVGEGTEFLYRISAAVCRVWTSDDCAGWLYPSVKSFGGENVALKPSAASENLRVKEAYLCEVSSVSDVTLNQQAVATVDGDTVTWADAVGARRYFRSA